MPPPSTVLRALTQTPLPPLSKASSRRGISLLYSHRLTRHNSTIPKRQLSARLLLPQQQPNLTPSPSQLRSQHPRHASSTTTELKHTPLYNLHTSLNAKMGPFAGFSMPLSYPPHSHVTSHLWTRSSASIFDVSHMVQHKLSGPLAEQFLMTITPSAVDALPKHTSTLSVLLDSNGGIVDDTVITRLGRDSFYFVTNAGCREQDFTFIQSEMDKFLSSQPKSSSETGKPITWHILEHHSLLALQGPLAQTLLQPLLHLDSDDDHVDTDLSTLYFGHSRWLQLDIPEICTKEGTSLSTPSLLISRTGYTGEDGFEISIPPESGCSAALATSIAKALLEAKTDGSTEPACRMAGLAARDSLRLEAGMCLYGHDIDTDVTPPMAGLGWVVAKSRRNGKDPKFNGADRISEQLASPKTMERRRVGFIVENGPAAREGAEIVAMNDDGSAGETIGRVTSGCPAPSLEGKNIAMGYVKNGFHKKGTKVGVKVRGKVRKGEVERMPFVESKFYRGTD